MKRGSQVTPWVHEQISIGFLMFSHQKEKCQSILSVMSLQIQIKPKVISPEVINAVVPHLGHRIKFLPKIRIWFGVSKYQTTCAPVFLK